MIGILVWGTYAIVTVSLLQIPTKSLSVITAGLAAGLGFAMKDILNNFFYGVQLMSGRLRVGDYIECDGVRGKVDSINYQMTQIAAEDGSVMAFTNSTLSNNDFYQTMGDAQKLGKYFSGYNDKWNWMDFYAHADYTLAHALMVGMTASADGASSIGDDASRFSLYPAGEVVLMAKELSFLKHADFVNKLNVFAKYGATGNSRFSSKFGKYYYTSFCVLSLRGK